MRKTIFKLAAASVALSAMSAAAPAFAEEEAAAEEEASGPFDVTLSATVTSDYRFRGVSLSDKDIAFQPSITVAHESGFYVGAWGSNLAENPGDDVEVDIFAGFSGGSDALTFDIGATYYLYPGVSSFNYVEFAGKLGTTVGPAKLGAIVAYAPSQDGTGNTDNIYVGGNASIGLPESPISITGSLGYEDGAFGNDKIDWSLGLSAAVGDHITVSASYVDTNRFIGGLGKAGAVVSATVSF